MKNYFVKKMVMFCALLLLYAASFNCASYRYEVAASKAPVQFAPATELASPGRRFKFKRKITWGLFDLFKVQRFDLGQALNEELPDAKLIYNLRIRSRETEEDVLVRGGSMIIFFLGPNRPLLLSRRTIVVDGFVVE